MTRNWEDAEDAIQDSFLKAFLHLKEFEGRSSFSSWFGRKNGEGIEYFIMLVSLLLLIILKGAGALSV